MNFGESSFLTQQLSPPDLRAKLHASTMDQGQGRKASSTAGYEEEMEWVNFEELLRSHFFPRLYPPQPQLCLPSFPYGAELQKTGSLLPMGTVRILQFLPLTCNLPGNPSLPQAKLISPFGFQYLNTFVCQALIFFFFYCGKLRIYVKVEERWWAPWLPTHHSVSTIINSRPSQFQANPLLLPSCHMPLLVLVSLFLPQGTRFSEISPCPVPLYILTALSKISCVG